MLQLVSPALPVGGFSYSEGLEWQIQKEKIINESTLFEWLKAELLRGQIRLEASAQSFIRDSLDDWQSTNEKNAIADLVEWDNWLLALRDSDKIRSQQKQMGQSLIQVLLKLGCSLPEEAKNFSWPSAWGCGGLFWKLSKVEVIEGYLYNWVANQLSAGIRLMPLGPTEAQQLQFSLLPLIETQAKELLSKNPHHLWTGDVGATIAQSSHSELYSKLFRS